MPTKTIQAIILSRKNFGEADRLLTAYSKEEGKVKILAKGSRKIKSKMASHIEPFTLGKYFVAKGKSFYILAGAETLNSNYQNLNDIELFKQASYICELLELATVEEQKNAKLFQLAKNLLTCLPETPEEKREIIIRFFEFVLLESSGYLPDYTRCKKCHTGLTQQNTYIGNFEGVCCSSCEGEGKKIDLNALKILRVFASRDLEKVLVIAGVERYNDSLKEVILPHLYDIIPRSPKSKTL